eukprot:3269692-Prymnesium_polylepis.3
MQHGSRLVRQNGVWRMWLVFARPVGCRRFGLRSSSMCPDTRGAITHIVLRTTALLFTLLTKPF